jgi:hypothetical protein
VEIELLKPKVNDIISTLKGDYMRFGEKPTVKKETTQPVTSLPEETVEDLNSTAFSLIRGPESGFSLVEVKFNPITGNAKVESVKKVSDSREEGEYYFRVKVGEYFADQERKS